MVWLLEISNLCLGLDLLGSRKETLLGLHCLTSIGLLERVLRRLGKSCSAGGDEEVLLSRAVRRLYARTVIGLLLGWLVGVV